MAIYGQQDAMRHEHRDQLQELVVVRGFGDEFDRHFYVKMMRGDLRAPKGSKSTAVQLFMESAQTQQRVANAGSPNWAMVHMAGTGPKGPYVVLDYYPRSANEFVENKTPVSPRSLHRMITGVVDGLIDLQRVADRPHGNLKPSNVLIGPGEVERAEIALADPAPLELLATQGRGDSYDLGQLIHCLVLQRRFTGNWPIEPSAGWTSLGSRAKGWRELCNRLLNPNPDKRPRLRQVRADLNKLQPGGSRVPRVAIGAALGTFVLAAGAAFYVYDPLDLRRDEGRRDVAISPATTRPTQPTTQPTTNPAMTRTTPASPTTQMATATGEETAPLVQSPVLASSASSPQQTPAGQQEKPSVATTTTPPTVTPTPEAPVVELPAAQMTQVREAQSAFASRGWTGAAKHLQELTTRLARPETKPEAADAAALESAGALATQIERDWETVAKTQAALTAVDDRIVRSYDAAVAQATAAGKSEASPESVRKLADSLNRLATDADWAKVVAFVQSPQFKELDLVYLTQASEAYRNFGDKQIAAAEDLRAWLADASSGRFTKLDPAGDPRRDWKAAEQLERLRDAELPRLAKLSPATGDDEQLAGLRQQLKTVGDRIAALQKNDSWDRRHDDGVRNGVREVNETLAKLEAELKQAIAQRESDAAMAQARAKEQAESAKRLAEVRAFVGELDRTTVSAIAPIQKAWQEQIRSVTEALEKNPAQLGPQTRTNVSELQQRLRSIDVTYRSLPAPAPPRADQPQWAQALVKLINGAAAERREAFLTGALAALRSGQTPEQSREATTELADAYRTWLEGSGSFLADVGDLQSLLAAGYMPDEKPDAKTPTPRETLARVERHALWQDERVRQAVAPLVRPLVLADSDEWKKPLKAATSADAPLGVRVAAWERLAASAHAPWPADQEDVAENFRVEEALRGAVKERAGDGARLKQLTARVEQPGRRNWQRFLTRAASQQDVEFALRLKDRYVADVTTLDRRSQFNVLLHDLRRLMVEAEKDPGKQRAVQDQIVRIEQAIAALPADVSAQRDMAALASAVRAFRAAAGAGAATVDADRLAPMASLAKGPGAIPWTYSYDPQTQTLTCVAELPRQLTAVPPEIVFKRLEGDGRTGAFFLSTTEISVGLFGDVIRAAGKSAEFERLLRGAGAPGRDARVGPRSWALAPWGSRTIFTRTGTWFPDDRPDHYAPALSDSLNSTVLKDELGRRAEHLNPSNRHPMQYVPPQAAIEFAKLLGCRLQTPEEWRAAYQTSRTERPNLRDQTWRIQHQWAADRRANQYLPDRGIFVPSGENPSREVWTESQLQGRARSEADRAYNDGVLFFHEVAPYGGQSFNHLVGNVAEYAFAGERLYVVGASALSPPPPVRGVDQAYEVPNWRDKSNEGYSDVGFRLAFDAPPAPFEQLRMVVEKQPYLTAAAGAAAAGATTRPIAASE